jgi:hypothetical protein
MNAFKKVVRPMRIHINLSHERQVRYWTKHLGVSMDDLQSPKSAILLRRSANNWRCLGKAN